MIRVEHEISKRLIEQRQSLKTIKENKINIASITSAVSITRKTAYNNDVLKSYTEYAGKLYEAGYPINGFSELKERLADSKDIIGKLVRRDVDIENM